MSAGNERTCREPRPSGNRPIGSRRLVACGDLSRLGQADANVPLNRSALAAELPAERGPGRPDAAHPMDAAAGRRR